jgi:neutral ceramidase
MTDAGVSAGFGKSDITVYEAGMCMFGWGQPGNEARGVAAPLFARALAVESAATGARWVYVCADLGMISLHLRERVMSLLAERRLGLDDHGVMLTATHTHSGPNGYSKHLFYGVTAPGFSEHVTDGLARGIVAAIEMAVMNLTPARLHVVSEPVPLVEAVSFNRSLAAYNQNGDVEPVAAGRSDEATDREMVVLRVDDVAGHALGLVSWFPVHGTSIHHENTLIHPDNKGIAAQRCEEVAASRFRVGSAPFVAIFAQEAAGDVTPNFRFDHARGLLIGRHDDDFASAEHAGAAQAKHALDLFAAARSRGSEVRGPLDARIHRRDFSNLTVDPDLADGREGRTTSIACLGLAFAFGTLEGPGPAFAARALHPLLSDLVSAVRRVRRPDWRTPHGAKVRFFDLGLGAAGKIAMVIPTLPPGFHLVPDRRVAYYCDLLRSGTLGSTPWVPHVLPVQILRIGSLAIVGVPVEPTTVSGRRMRAAVSSAFAHAGVSRIVVNGYANGYASYVTTLEEYRVQLYEGASTLFGQWTLGAFCTELRRVAREMSAARAPSPALPTPASRHGALPRAEGACTIAR